jgi:hypothetical protein
MQLGVARIGPDHLVVGRMKAVGDHPPRVVGRHLGRTLEPDGQMRVPGAVVGKGADLRQQRRHQVERDTNAREFAQQRHHAPVVLDGVEPHPRQDVVTGGEIHVIRLMHVPQEGEFHHPGTA